MHEPTSREVMSEEKETQITRNKLEKAVFLKIRHSPKQPGLLARSRQRSFSGGVSLRDH